MFGIKKHYLIFIPVILLSIYLYRQMLIAIANQYSLPKQYKNYDILSEKDIQFGYGNEKVTAKISLINSKIEMPTVLGLSKIILLKDGGHIELPGYGEGLNWWEVGDFNGNGEPDVAVMYKNMGSGSYDQFYLYEWNGENFEIKMSNMDLFNEDELIDLDKDGKFEIRHKYRLDKFAFPWEDIYKWNNEKNEYTLANNQFPDNYKQWLNNNNNELKDYPVPDGEYLKEINICLTDKAILFTKGIYGDIDECLKIAQL